MVLDLRDLELFLEIGRTGSISAGAERCGLSLSAASARMGTLERRVGAALLERHRRGVDLTSAGEALATDAVALLRDARAVEEKMLARSHGITHELRLGVNSSAVDSLPDVITAALNRMPAVTLDLVELRSPEAVKQVREGTLELAVISVGADPVDGCQTTSLWDDSLVVVGPSSLGRAQPLSLRQTVAEPMVGLNRDLPLQQLIEREAERSGLQPTLRVRFPTLSAVCAAATAGVGRAIVPISSARRHGVPSTAQHALVEPWAQREAVLVAKEFAALSHVAGSLVNQLIRFSDEVTQDS